MEALNGYQQINRRVVGLHRLSRLRRDAAPARVGLDEFDNFGFGRRVALDQRAGVLARNFLLDPSLERKAALFGLVA